MKTIFRTFIIAGAVVLAASCGNNGKKTETAPAVVEEVAPSVAVAQVFEREVPQMATYTSTVAAVSVFFPLLPQDAANTTAPATMNVLKIVFIYFFFLFSI